MTMTRPRLPFAGALALLVLAAGCDSALDPEPFGIETIENQLSSPQGAVPFVTGIYEPLAGLYGSNGAPMTLILESGTDDAWPFAQFAGSFKERGLTGGENEIRSMWGKQLGDGIGRANFYLESEGAIDFGSQDALRRQLRGEALFLRAFYYFNLVRTFGDVPLFTTALRTVESAQVPRTPTAEVYAQIKADLSEAIPLLPDTYAGSGLGQEVGRVTSGAARTLLGKVHLTLEEWQRVLDVTAPLEGRYSLRPNYIDNFYGLIGDTGGENRVESIFEVQFAVQGSGPTSQIRVNYTPVGVRDGQNRLFPTDDAYLRSEPGAYGPNALVQAFEPGDARFGVTLDRFGATRSSNSGVYPARDANGNVVTRTNANGEEEVVLAREYFVRKWFSDVGNTETRWNVPILRYAEVLLMRAEAFAELGQTANAVPLVNRVRQRAGLAPLAADVDVVQAVRRERRTELAFEHKRLFDLNRWGILPQALALQGVQIDPSKVTAHPVTGKPQVLYPISSDELQRNPNATQNAGY